MIKKIKRQIDYVCGVSTIEMRDPTDNYQIEKMNPLYHRLALLGSSLKKANLMGANLSSINWRLK